MGLMFQFATEQTESDIRVHVSVGERHQKTPAYDLQPVGTLSMPADQWDALATALTKGIKRPHVVTFV